MPSRVVEARRKAVAFGFEGEHFTEEEWLALLERCGRVCLACGADEDLRVDHIVPLSLGGPDTMENVQPLCIRCNCLMGATVRDYRPVEAYLP